MKQIGIDIIFRQGVNMKKIHKMISSLFVMFSMLTTTFILGSTYVHAESVPHSSTKQVRSTKVKKKEGMSIGSIINTSELKKIASKKANKLAEKTDALVNKDIYMDDDEEDDDEYYESDTDCEDDEDEEEDSE